MNLGSRDTDYVMSVGNPISSELLSTAESPSPSRLLRCDSGAAAQLSLDPFLQLEIDTLRSINARLLREIEVLKQREAHALMLADRDGLTGLYNRRRMAELLETTVEEAARDGSACAVMFIDLDGFKRINDHFGHTLGDELLKLAAGRIGKRVRTGDIACRYGGDEFIVILPRVPSREAAEDVAASVAALLALPYRLSGEELRVTAALGLSMYPEDGRSAMELLHSADQLMYRCKATARGGEARVATPPLSRRRDDQPRRPQNS